MNAVTKIPTPKAALTSGNAVAAMVPNSIESAWRLSEVIAASGMAPKTYGTDPNKIMVGMLAGMEIGLTPFAALQSIAVINGNPSLWGDGALALIQASNLLEDMDETDDGNEATCMMKRAGRATAIVRTFSMEDAKRAGLVGKAGPWTQYTRRMRQMRARSIAMRDGFADVLKGLRIAEEVRDYAEFSDATPRPAQGVSVPLSGAMLLEQAAPDEDSPAVVPPATAADTPSTDAGQSTGAASNEDKARAYFDNVCGMVDEATDRVTLGEIETRARAKLANRAELLKALLPLIAAKLAFLDGIDAPVEALAEAAEY
jgi:hypothetical protein